MKTHLSKFSCSGWVLTHSDGENSELVEILDSHGRDRRADKTEDANVPAISDLAADLPSLWLV